MANATTLNRRGSAAVTSAAVAAAPTVSDTEKTVERCPLTGAILQHGQTIAAQWHWDDAKQAPDICDMAIPQVLRHKPTVAIMKWLKSIFFDKNRDMTEERRNVIQRALNEHKFVDSNDLAVVCDGKTPTLMNYHHRGTEVLKFLEAGGELDTAISVLYGVPFANIKFFDTGKNRSTTQIAKIMGQSIPAKSVPLTNVLFEMLGETKLLSPDERIESIQSIEPQIESVRKMLGASRKLRQPVVEAAFVSAVCHLEEEADADEKLDKLSQLASVMRTLAEAEDAGTETESGSMDADDPAQVTGNAMLNRINLYERGKKNGSERTTAFYLLQEGIYRCLNGERVLQLRPKVRGYSPQYPLPLKITTVTNIKSRFDEDEEETAVEK